MFGIREEYLAYCLDEAVAIIGNHITGVLDSITGKNARSIEARRTAALNRMLGITKPFKNPAPTK